MKKLAKIVVFLVSIIFTHARGGTITKTYAPENFDSTNYYSLLDQFGKNKILPKGFEKQTLIALSFFPELKNIHIVFRVKKVMIPLASRPTILSVFHKAPNRTYIITISSKSLEIMDPILLHRLNYNAQIGVLGHEISHVAYYNKLVFLEFLRLCFGLFQSGFMDKFEYNTDKICIEHGLGYQLLAWSLNIRAVFPKEAMIKMFGEDAAKRERYMFPETIERYIAGMPLYRTFP